MLFYLLKSGACLAIFMAFYKFFLERENMHVIKRYYLLASVLIAFAIPLVTFTHYMEVASLPIVNEPMEATVYYSENLSQIQETNYLPIVLWTIYGIGVFVFGVKFLINLLQIIFKINRNPKQTSKHIVHVLLSDLITPHTFFKYIFLNKLKFENHDIPQAVFWHEETHAKQKHTIDVLFIEFIQVIFWFNPLIYFAKQAIKMNHEFLADQAVLKKGVKASNYQHMLLAFSSNATEPQLSNAINYSSIKKRFTVMKTQTSKQNMWLKSILLLPLLALTLYGFSEKREVAKENAHLKTSQSHTQFLLVIAKTNEVLVNGMSSSISTFRDDLNSITKDWNASDFKTVIPDLRTASCSQEFLDRLDLEFRKSDYFLQSLKSLDSNQQKATPEEIAEYNKLAKYYNTQTDDNRIIKLKDMKRIRELQNKMTEAQKANAEPLPNFPPPPPPTAKDGSRNAAFVDQTVLPPPPPPANASEKQIKAYKKALETYKIQKESYTYKHTNDKGDVVDIIVIPENDGMVPPPPPPVSPPAPKDNTQTQIKTGFVVAKGEKLYYVANSNGKTYYNRRGNKVDKDGNKLNGNVQVNASDVIPGQYITKVYSDNEIVVEFRNDQNKRDATLEILAPPLPPASPLDHVIEMAKKNAVFFYEGKSVSSDEAVKIIKENGALNISTKQSNSKEPQVFITKEPINTDN